MSSEFACAGRVLFGAGVLGQAGAVARELGGSRALVVTGRSTQRAAPLLTQLEGAGLVCEVFAVAGEPTVDVARAGVEAARAARCDLVAAIGGGSALDAGKAIAALIGNGGDALDYLEVVGRGQPLTRPSLPLIAIPTTAGTGSEVTRNAVLSSPEHGVKASLRSRGMLPAAALVDPDLLLGAPPEVLAACGMDALSQLIEPYVSARAQPLTDGLACEGIRRSARSLRRAYQGQLDAGTREDLAAASVLGGLCLANAGLGAVHGFAAPLGGMFDAPHGAVCGALLPAVMETNLRALESRAPDSPARARYQEIARLLTGRPDASAADGVAWVRQLCRDLAIPSLAHHGLTDSDIPQLADKARAASSMRGNPIALTDDELSAIAQASL